jgi:uncharacterized circularly permuted ATP-grasp superfamily protein/uncharacterized alpha-E superfamily protein
MLDPLFTAYPPAQQRFDELFTPDNTLRPQWQALLDDIAQTSPAVMAHRVKTVERQVRENGVTYNVYADPKGTDRPWALDVLPFVLPAAEWAHIEAAVQQRAALMNRLLLDIYGEQTLLSNGQLPAPLVHGHAGFLRPCHGIQPLDGVALHNYAVDLARSPDGRWWVTSDRTQAPSGAGYALENRLIIARHFAKQFGDLNVQRLSGFFTSMRDSLAHWGRAVAPYQGQSLAPNERPLIVLLTPGPYNETYYEQSFLARYLSFPLVQGSDLTVRDGFVWLKTLLGLQRVHVIVRRVDDDYCDPLELRKDSALGVAGLTEAARRGTVLLANPLGSNLLESGALLGFLPKLSEQLLGEPLKMPSVGTWWCGEPAALEDAIVRIKQLVFKPTFPQLRQPPVFGEDLDDAQRAAFIAQLRANPHNYVAQEMVRFSQAPVWQSADADTATPAGVGAAAVSVRVFACATPNGYVVMPGGLARVATGLDARVVAMQRGGGSKDTWVMTDGTIDQRSLIAPAVAAHDLIRGETNLASRTVENLFWFGRYTERCDNTARLMRRCFDSLIDAAPDKRGHVWLTLVALCRHERLLKTPQTPEQLKQLNGKPDDAPMDDASIQAALLKAVSDASVPGLACDFQQLFRTGFNLRERLSTDNWRSLNTAVQRLSKTDADLSLGDAVTVLDEATTSLMTLAGFTLDGMTRDMGWRFLSTGRRIERLQFMCTLVLHALAMPSSGNKDWLLELGDSIVTYRSRYMARPEWMPVLDLLLLDASNPRGVAFQLDGLLSNLRKIALVHGPCGADIIAPLLNDLRSLQPQRDLQLGSPSLIALMQRVSAATGELSESLTAQFFSYAAHTSGLSRANTLSQPL